MRVISFCFIITIAVLPALSGSAASTKSFSLTDYANDIRYTITVERDLVTISSGNEYAEFYADEGIVASTVFDGVFKFMSCAEKNNNNYMTVFYSFDINTGSLSSFATKLQCKYDEYSFIADKYEKYYFIDRYDNSVIHCCTKTGTEYSVDCGGEVYQIMCIDGVNITAVTSGGVYLIYKDTAEKVSEHIPRVPCYYTGGDFVTDDSGAEYSYSDGILTPIVTVTTTVPVTDSTVLVEFDIEINDNYIYAPVGITAAKLRNSLNLSKDNLRVTKENGDTVNSGKLGTGMTAVFGGKRYTVIVRGDLTGEGNVNSRDLNLVMKYLTGEVAPDTVRSLAADVNYDDDISTKDMLGIAQMY